MESALAGTSYWSNFSLRFAGYAINFVGWFLPEQFDYHILFCMDGKKFIKEHMCNAIISRHLTHRDDVVRYLNIFLPISSRDSQLFAV